MKSGILMFGKTKSKYSPSAVKLRRRKVAWSIDETFPKLRRVSAYVVNFVSVAAEMFFFCVLWLSPVSFLALQLRS